MAAAGGGHAPIVEVLLAAGAEVNATGWTALMGAAGGGHERTVDLLLAAGADVNAVPGAYGLTALMGAAKGGHIGTVRALLEPALPFLLRTHPGSAQR